jgi:hypothetical protein
VLHALTGMASQFRKKAGESLKTVQEHAKPLEEATTSSLEALKAYSTGVKVQNASGSLSAIPFLKRAIELDPKFAQAYAYLSRMYGDVGDCQLSSEIAAKAYELRDQASDPERFFITAHYYIAVTGNMEKALETCAAWAQTYPREKAPTGFEQGSSIRSWETLMRRSVNRRRSSDSIRIFPSDIRSLPPPSPLPGSTKRKPPSRRRPRRGWTFLIFPSNAKTLRSYEEITQRWSGNSLWPRKYQQPLTGSTAAEPQPSAIRGTCRKH